MSWHFTECRKKKAIPILDDALSMLHKNGGSCLPPSFEKDIRECWHLGYQELKGIMIDMMDDSKYQPVAVKYMTKGAVVSEFQRPLKKFLLISNCHDELYENALKQYWNFFNAVNSN